MGMFATIKEDSASLRAQLESNTAKLEKVESNTASIQAQLESNTASLRKDTASLQAEVTKSSAILTTHSEETKANFLAVRVDMSTLESTLKTDFKDQLAKRDKEIDRKFDNLSQKIEDDAMAVIDGKLETWKSFRNTHRSKLETRIGHLETTRESSTEDFEKIM